jgi:hypothetical protein
MCLTKYESSVKSGHNGQNGFELNSAHQFPELNTRQKEQLGVGGADGAS